MRYLCLIYLDGKMLEAMPSPEMSALNARHLVLNEELLARGQFIEAEALQPSPATTCVRVRNGKVAVTDGPYAEAKEVVGGIYILKAKDYAEAAELASTCPHMLYGRIEVREVDFMGQPEP